MASFAELEAMPVPPTRFLVRGRHGLECFRGPPTVTPDSGVIETPIDAENLLHGMTNLSMKPVYSSDGALVCLVRESDSRTVSLSIHHSESGALVGSIPVSNAEFVEFSPRGTYLVTWARPKTDETDRTLKVWEVATQSLITSYHQKKNDSAVLQWTADEAYCCQLVTNEVRIMNGTNLPAGPVAKCFHKGVSQYKVSPITTATDSVGCNIAVFVPEKNGKHASASLYVYNGIEGNTTADGPHATRSMFSATEANMMWNAAGSVVLVHASSDVDRSGSSYYGASGLYALGTQMYGNFTENVPLSKAGPIYDVQWSPNGDKFVVAAGVMPSRCTMYNVKAEMTFNFGEAHRNTALWSPHGRFLMLAGFGNLAGEMDFYDTNKNKKIGTNKAHCSVSYGWSPDSRYFMTAVLAPRMNVDNCYKIFKYNGVGPVAMLPFEQAFDCMWQPQDSKLCPNRGQSPRRDGTDGKQPVRIATIAAEAEAPVKVAAPAYRPPSARGLSSGLAEKLKRDTAPVGKVKAEVANPKWAPRAGHERVIPGMAAPPPVKKIAADPTVEAARKEAKKKAEKEKKAAIAAAKAAEEEASKELARIAALPKPIDELSAEEKEKRAKNLRKKLKTIDELKLKAAAGMELNSDQLKKIDSVSEIMADLSKLGM